jgi:hypothetical protein
MATRRFFKSVVGEERWRKVNWNDSWWRGMRMLMFCELFRRSLARHFLPTQLQTEHQDEFSILSQSSTPSYLLLIISIQFIQFSQVRLQQNQVPDQNLSSLHWKLRFIHQHRAKGIRAFNIYSRDSYVYLLPTPPEDDHPIIPPKQVELVGVLGDPWSSDDRYIESAFFHSQRG